MTNMFSLAGRNVLLTGATGGIGAATARLCADAGARMLLTDNDVGACKALAADLPDAHAFAADLADEGQVRAMAEAALAQAGRIDVLICNAAMEGHVGPIGDADTDAVERLLSVNLKSALTLTSVLAPHMAAAGGGSIVLVASIAGLRGNKAIGLYGLSKAALIQLARNLAVEWGPLGVRCNSVSPGLIDTPFARPILDNPDYLPRRLSLTPLRRPGTAAEIAAALVFLASDAAGFMTGHNLVIDGGTTISDGN